MEQGHRFETLDAMRGLCALIVVVGHAPFALNTPKFPAHSWLSVDMFFVLSGFVIALTYESRLKSGMGITAFMTARARRLLPMQIAGTLICALCLAPAYWHEVPKWLLAVDTLLALFVIPTGWLRIANVPAGLASDFAINPPLWSLCGEWIVNGLYGLFLNRWSSRLLAIPVAIAAAHLIHMALAGDGSGANKIGLDRTVIGFILGVLIYRAYRANKFRRLPKIRPTLAYMAWLIASCVPVIGSYPLLDPLPGLALSACLVILLVQNEQPMGKTWAWLGALSYPLYVSHFAIINLLGWLMPSPTPHSAIWVIPLFASQVGLAAILSHALRRAWRLRPDGTKQLPLAQTH